MESFTRRISQYSFDAHRNSPDMQRTFYPELRHAINSPIRNCDVHQKKVRAHLHIVRLVIVLPSLNIYEENHHSRGEDIEAYSILILSLESLLCIAIFRMSVSFSYVKPTRYQMRAHKNLMTSFLHSIQFIYSSVPGI